MNNRDSQGETWIRQHFFFNVELSSALWVHIHCLEITLRNYINFHLTQIYGRADWWNTPNLLASRDLARIQKIEKMVQFQKKSYLYSSLLSLSFWVSLFTKRYHHKIWLTLRWPNEIEQSIGRESFHLMANEILALRNMIAHQKYILNRNLIRDHAYLHELTYLLNPELAIEVQKKSRVLDLLLNARLVGSGGGI